MKHKILKMVLGSFQTNCYIVYNEDKECALIDPGAQSKDIIQALEQYELTPIYILLTHAHADHIGAVYDLKEKYGIKIYMNLDDREMLEDRGKSRAQTLGLEVKPTKADVFVEEGDEIPFGTDKFVVIDTPGHTPGGVCYLLDDVLFSGDTLFNGSIGRTDFPESNHKNMMHSLKKLTELPKDTIVLSGHGPETTIEQELRYNPFLRML
ncbi:MAG: MBL fold metallo-hydrolase [Tissierellia bacterium]|nr:MBL fold metallo-hydrolase [Tissierellia bacterium]